MLVDQPGDDRQVKAKGRLANAWVATSAAFIFRHNKCRFERLTGKKAHPLLRRGIFYTHRDLDEILNCYEKGQPFYLYTGRVGHQLSI